MTVEPVGPCRMLRIEARNSGPCTPRRCVPFTTGIREPRLSCSSRTTAEPTLLAGIFAARPEVLARNIETVPRLFREIRPGFRYERSISVIA